MKTMSNLYTHPIVMATAFVTWILSMLHFITLGIGFLAGSLTLAAGFYYFRTRYAEWEEKRKSNPENDYGIIQLIKHVFKDIFRH